MILLNQLRFSYFRQTSSLFMHTLILLISLTFLPFQTVQNQDPIEKQLDLKLKQSKELTSQAYYPEAYDKLWNILIVADSIKNTTIKYKTYTQLSILYSIFHKKEQAIATLDSVFLYAKQSKDFKELHVKSNIYYSAALTYRMNDQYEKAKQFLKISEQLLDSLNGSNNDKIYVLTEKAHLNTLTGNYVEADSILKNISKQISPKHEYASIVYSMLGDLYAEKEDKNNALSYYNKSLDVISDLNSRIGLKVELLAKASKLNEELGNYKIAYEEINTSKLLGDSLFGSQSRRNKQLFEIKDSYRKSIIEHNEIKKEQELKYANAQREKLNLQLIFSILLFLITVLAAFIGVKLLRKKHVLEKKLVKERAGAEIELKKKELALTALKLIEKDTLLAEIKKGLEEVKRDKEDVSVEKIKHTIKINSKKTWEEFETRFIQVNGSFYESLSEKHQNLSRNELKLCALMKLNFSTKEMAQLLGVSADSVNKARYRLRKKLGLHRDDNLATFINSF